MLLLNYGAYIDAKDAVSLCTALSPQNRAKSTLSVIGVCQCLHFSLLIFNIQRGIVVPGVHLLSQNLALIRCMYVECSLSEVW